MLFVNLSKFFREVPPDIWFDPKWEWHRQVHRGHGYWFWKSAMVRRLLEKTVPKGEVLVYADAGCEFGLTSGQNRFQIRACEP